MQDMQDSNFIKSELVARGITQVSIANMLKVSRVTVNKVITGHRKNPRVRQAIALAIGKEVQDITWPEQPRRES